MQNKLLKILLTLCALALISKAEAQILLKGRVVSNDSAKAPIAMATVFVKSSAKLLATAEDGSFQVLVAQGDSIRISHVAHYDFTYKVKASDEVLTKTFFLFPKRADLQEIRISNLTKYQRDSLERARLFSKAVNYEQTASVLSPVTSLYEQFSKKYQSLRKLQAQIASDEQQKFIDTKYKYELVVEITKLEGDSAAEFMMAYPMEYKFARLASEAEIKMWVLNNFKKYKANGYKPTNLGQ